jgi:hypothetical protein
MNIERFMNITSMGEKSIEVSSTGYTTHSTLTDQAVIMGIMFIGFQKSWFNCRNKTFQK